MTRRANLHILGAVRPPPLALALSLVGALSTHWGCGGQGCTLIGCSNEGYEVFFDSDSRWGEGVHTVALQWSPPGSEYLSGYSRCRIYPYSTGRNAECDPIVANSAQTYFSDRSIRILEHPDYLRIDISDESGWSMRHIIGDPEYDVSYPNGRKCDDGCRYGTTTITLDGPGDLAGYVQDLYPVSESPAPEEGLGGAGGASARSSEVGARCERNADCSLPGFCFAHFLGSTGLCTQSCLTDADCPVETVCGSSLIDDSFERLDGYCLRPCSDVATCVTYGSHCNIQDSGHFCF